VPPAIDLGFPAYIPKNYIPIERHRMDAYRKIAVARTPADLEQIQAELADVYGPVPDEVTRLIELAELRIGAAKWDIRSIIVQMSPNDVPPEGGRPTGDLIFSFRNDPGRKANRLFASTHGSVRIPDPKTVHLRLPEAYFEPQTLLRFLQKMFAAANK
jgi:transcription-repair coupling factor (superfamily II helicase)